MDPTTLYANPAQIKSHVEEMLKNFGTSKHIANLGHGLHPDHSPEHVGAFIEYVHQISRDLRK